MSISDHCLRGKPKIAAIRDRHHFLEQNIVSIRDRCHFRKQKIMMIRDHDGFRKPEKAMIRDRRHILFPKIISITDRHDIWEPKEASIRCRHPSRPFVSGEWNGETRARGEEEEEAADTDQSAACWSVERLGFR